MNIGKILHDITQLGFGIRFNGDFQGMVTTTFYEDGYNGDTYIRHEHVGFPGCDQEHFEQNLSNCLLRFLKEAIAGKPEKDGLAK